MTMSLNKARHNKRIFQVNNLCIRIFKFIYYIIVAQTNNSVIAYSEDRGRGLQGINGINIAIDKNNIGIDTFFFTTTKESEKKYKNRKMDECPHNAHFRKINGIINRLKPGK
jgi:hypothetical protein